MLTSRIQAREQRWAGLEVRGVNLRREEHSNNATNSTNKSSGTSKTTIIAPLAVLGAFVIIGAAIYILVRRRRRGKTFAKKAPSRSIKDRWQQWLARQNRARYSSRLQGNDSASLHPVSHTVRGNSRSASPALESMRTPASGTMTPHSTVERNRDLEAGNTRGTPAGNQDAVDRHTSVRSVMTLPVYSADPRATEQILGREGERAGIDVVLEFPETQDDVEDRREAEMDSLYRIRRARRAEATEREERRRLRREARARGDWAEVERLRIEAREAQQRRDRELEGSNPVGAPSAARLIAEHQEQQAQRERQRRISSVQYAELGVARHDGSRVRAGSNASVRSEDNRPLLNGAAGMGQDGTAERRGTISTLGDTLSVHNRNRSTSSVLSVSSIGTDEDDTGSIYQPPFAPGGRGRSLTTTTVDSSPDFEVVSLHEGGGAATPRASQSRSHSRNDSTSRLAQVQTNSSSQFESQNHQSTQMSTISLQTSSEDRSSDLERTQTSQSNHPHLLETPVEAPPHYEHLAETTFGEPPTYQSPITAQGPGIERLPSIRVSESVTPVDGPSRTENNRW